MSSSHTALALTLHICTDTVHIHAIVTTDKLSQQLAARYQRETKKENPTNGAIFAELEERDKAEEGETDGGIAII